MKPSLKVTVRGTKVVSELTGVLTSGMVGVPVTFQFDEDWGDLRKLGVFEGSGQKKHLDLNLGDELTIPWEVLTEEQTLLKVGVEWRKPDGTVVIPTRWANVAVTLPGAQAGNDPALEPTPTVYDQIMQAIDDGRLQGEPGYTPVKGIDYNDGAPGYTPVKGKDYFDGQDGVSPVVSVEDIEGGHKVTITDVNGEKTFEVKDGKDGNDGSDSSPIVCNATGEAILLTDSAEQKLRGLKLYGKSEQFTTTGANLLKLEDKTKSSYGVTVTVKDGVVTVTGTATDRSTIGVLADASNGTKDIFNVPIGTYYLSGEDLKLQVYRGAKDSYDWYGAPCSFTLNEGDYACYLYLQYDKGTVTNKTIYPMLNTGTAALPYEPYTGGKASPNPEYPQEIVSAGQDGDIGAKVCGANLFALGEFQGTSGGSASGYFTVPEVVKDEILSLPNGTYTASYAVTATSGATAGSLFGKIAFQKADGSFKVNATKIFTINDDVRQNTATIVLYGYVNTVNTVTDFMLNLGTTDLPYEPYKGNIITVPTPNGLPGIKVASGGNYTDSTGQQWVCDEIDYAPGVYIQRVYKATEKDFRAFIWTSTGAVCFRDTGNQPTPNPDFKNALCNISSAYMTSWNPKSYASHFLQKNGQRLVVVLPNTYTTEEQGRAVLDNGVEFIYPLLEPIERPLTEEEMAEFEKLHTNYPKTNIFNNEGAGMEVSYVADTKNYIDKKFTELAAAIVANA